MDEILKKLDELIVIQCVNGTWNYNSYHFGLANGLILARSAVTGEEPEFLTAPDEWLEDTERVSGPTEPVTIRCSCERCTGLARESLY